MTEDRKIKNKDVSIVILVGGLGTRIRKIYPNQPKPLIIVEFTLFNNYSTNTLLDVSTVEFRIAN